MKDLSRVRWLVLAVLVIVAVTSSLVSYFVFGESWGSLLQNFGTEMLGAVVTYALLELVIGKREEKEQEQEEIEKLKADLIAKMGSDVRDVAVPAAEELRRRGWLRDGSLIQAKLIGANLSRADLVGANLSRADLGYVNLAGAGLWTIDFSGADLLRANLSEASLYGARLVRAYLVQANLEAAHLEGVLLVSSNLKGANLKGANLKDASLKDVNLEGANLGGAEVTDEQLATVQSLRNATMPDGRKYEEWKAEGRLNLEEGEDESGEVGAGFD
jgi:hypothetical protein